MEWKSSTLNDLKRAVLQQELYRQQRASSLATAGFLVPRAFGDVGGLNSWSEAKTWKLYGAKLGDPGEERKFTQDPLNDTSITASYGCM